MMPYERADLRFALLIDGTCARQPVGTALSPIVAESPSPSLPSEISMFLCKRRRLEPPRGCSRRIPSIAACVLDEIMPNHRYERFPPKRVKPVPEKARGSERTIERADPRNVPPRVGYTPPGLGSVGEVLSIDGRAWPRPARNHPETPVLALWGPRRARTSIRGGRAAFTVRA